MGYQLDLKPLFVCILTFIWVQYHLFRLYLYIYVLYVQSEALRDRECFK